MIRIGLLAALSIATPLAAEDLRVPGLSPDPAPLHEKLDLPPCEETGESDNCARLLACFGSDGLWFDGQAIGMGEGTLIGQRSDGIVCAGQWSYGALFGSATATFECSDGVTGSAIFYAQDGLTGTGIARGIDSRGRSLRAWTGRNVLDFLGDGDGNAAELPCADAPIPIS